MPTTVTPVDRSARMASVSSLLAENWWLVALRGALSIAFGAIAFVLPGVALTTLVILFAAYMLVDGAFSIAAGVRAAQHHGRWGLPIVEGIVDIAVGVVAVLWPAIAVLAFVYLVAGWAIVSGIVMIVAAFRLHITHGRWLLAFAGLVSVLFGISISVAPIAGALALALWIGAYAIVFGVTLVVLGLRLRGRHAGRTIPPTTA